MKILVINCHSDNRGDEAAIHALVDEINTLYSGSKITLAIRGLGTQYPNMPSNVTMIRQFCPCTVKSNLAYEIAKLTNGVIVFYEDQKQLVNAIKNADYILHAPGGPSIGDTYYDVELTYLKVFSMVQKLKKPYMFYAPSMGPFENTERNELRKKILLGAETIVLRDPISAEYVRKFIPGKKVYQTLDSALQHDINVQENQKKYQEYSELCSFLDSHPKCVGLTITDLMWHPIHSQNQDVQQRIKDAFTKELDHLTESGWGVVFIPQLYGGGDDYSLMKSYCRNDKDFFVIPSDDERYDAYFQQYIISKLYAVIGMRYHSNIFSAKMSVPFVSVSYEQKMQGFMEKMKLQEYCISIQDLSFENLNARFELLLSTHDDYKEYLESIHQRMKTEAYQTTKILKESIDNQVV